jgi:hypothetical protein
LTLLEPETALVDESLLEIKLSLNCEDKKRR